MADSLDWIAVNFPERLLEYVEYRQEDAYRQLGRDLGTGPDPADAYAYLMGNRPAPVKLSPDEYRELYGWGAEFTPEEWEEVKAKIEAEERNQPTRPIATRFEDPETVEKFYEARDQLEKEAASTLGLKLGFDSLFATLPSGDTNAKVSLDENLSTAVFFLRTRTVQLFE